MDKLLEQLIENLAKERDIYKELLEISEQKKQVIMDKDIKQLEKIVLIEQEFIIQIGRLEDERRKIIDRIAAEKKVPAEKITISTIISWSPEDKGQRLENIKNEFEDIINRQKDLNKINEKLLKINLEYVDFAINFFTGNYGSGPVYEKKGQTFKTGQSRNLFDKKI